MNDTYNTIYIMLLKCNKYYIGYTLNRLQKSDFDNFIKTFNKIKMQWTTTYKPVEIIERFTFQILDINKIMEYHDRIVIHYMKKYGIENVRSCKYNDMVLGSELMKKLEIDINNFKYTDIYGIYNYISPDACSDIDDYFNNFIGSIEKDDIEIKKIKIDNEVERLNKIKTHIKYLQRGSYITSKIRIKTGSFIEYDMNTEIIYLKNIVSNEPTLLDNIYKYEQIKQDDNIYYKIDDRMRKIICCISEFKDDVYIKNNKVIPPECYSLSIILFKIIEHNIKIEKELNEILLIEKSCVIINFKINRLERERYNIYRINLQTNMINDIPPPPYSISWEYETSDITCVDNKQDKLPCD